MTSGTLPLPASRWEIAALIPHQGEMCLLEAVSEWTQDAIVCTTRTHAAADHPLARNGRLAAVHLCEYGAQAAAVHGGLAARDQGVMTEPGLLVALREVRLHVAEVTPEGELTIRARRVQAGETGWQYEFAVSKTGHLLASGRAMVMRKRP